MCQKSDLNAPKTIERPKILLLDDDKDMLELYEEILRQLPSNPEIFTSLTGARAIAMLEADKFTLLVSDLNMPKMDGLQVLSIVRRKYPELRTVVLTSVLDEQFRSRVYGLGVDLFWQKPSNNEEIRQFLECIESLLGRDQHSGFRGIQSKSLVDIIQLECLSLNSLVLKIGNGPLTGRIWIRNGDVIAAATEDLHGAPAFHRILSWKAGHFETLPAEPHQQRTIHDSYQGLLLAHAQAHDEAQTTLSMQPPQETTPLARFTRLPGVEFALSLDSGAELKFDARGLDNPEPVAEWSRSTVEQFRALGERLRLGPLQEVDSAGPQNKLVVVSQRDADFCIGWNAEIPTDKIQESVKKVLASWTF